MVPVTGGIEAPDDPYAAQLALLVESVTDYAVFLVSPEGVVKTWNRGAQRIKGYDREEIVGREIALFYAAEDRERGHPAGNLAVAAREGRFEEEGWRIRKDGSRFWANVVLTALRGPDGELVGFGKVTRDLTARRLSEEQLRLTAAEMRDANAELDQFRRLVAGVRDYAIFMLDSGGHIATWNPGAEHIKGYTESEAVGRHFSTFYTDEDRDRGHPAEELEIAAREGRYEEENWRVRKDGSRFWASVVITAVRNDHGVLVGFAKVTRDLTARREAEEAVRDASERLRRSNEELDRFATVAAHDLAAPLATISGFAELLAEQPLAPKALEYAGWISSSARRMHGLIGDLLRFARSGQDAVEAVPVDLGAAFGRAVDDLGGAIRETRAEVVSELEAPVVVLAGAADVEAVLRNLLGNAVKFADDRRPHVVVSAAPSGEAWRISVTDNGIGIGAADQDRIFGAFERARSDRPRDGSGLGLAICERVVRRHGGEIGVESAPGRGSTFWFTLPRAEGP